MTDTPLPNEPATRTPTGEIKDQAPVVTAPPTTTSETKTETQPPTVTAETKPATEPAPKLPNAPEPSLLNKEEKLVEPPKAPEKYEAFKLPEGAQLAPEVMTQAEGLFKELNLPQDTAQKLVDFHVTQLKAAMATPAAEFATTVKSWTDATMADPALGPRIKEIQSNIGKALATVGDQKLVADFRHIMDLTGAGSHPAFVKIIDKLAAAVLEGRPVNGTGPSKFGQANPNAAPRSAASAIYPNLPSA